MSTIRHITIKNSQSVVLTTFGYTMSVISDNRINHIRESGRKTIIYQYDNTYYYFHSKSRPYILRDETLLPWELITYDITRKINRLVRSMYV
jgi:hypothetical protein